MNIHVFPEDIWWFRSSFKCPLCTFSIKTLANILQKYRHAASILASKDSSHLVRFFKNNEDGFCKILLLSILTLLIWWFLLQFFNSIVKLRHFLINFIRITRSLLHKSSLPFGSIFWRFLWVLNNLYIFFSIAFILL